MTSKKESQWITAIETKSELQKDPEFIQRELMLKAQDEENAATYRRAAAKLLEELSEAGFVVSSVGELVKGPPYKPAVPILVKWLPLIADKYVKDDIIRTLSVPWGKEAVPALIEEFKRPVVDPERNYIGWVIGNALSVLATKPIFPELVDLIQQRRYGDAREMLAFAVAKTKHPEAIKVLVGLLDDEQIAGHVLSALVRLKAKISPELIKPFLTHKTNYIRKEAKKLMKFAGSS